jgi:hypothetical protein
MGRIHKRIVIEAPLEGVFEFVADWRNATKFYRGLTLRPEGGQRGG